MTGKRLPADAQGKPCQARQACAPGIKVSAAGFARGRAGGVRSRAINGANAHRDEGIETLNKNASRGKHRDCYVQYAISRPKSDSVMGSDRIFRHDENRAQTAMTGYPDVASAHRDDSLAGKIGQKSPKRLISAARWSLPRVAWIADVGI